MKKVLNASIMRIIMTLLLIVILVAMIGAVTFAYSFLSKASEDVGKIKNKSALKTSRTHYQTILNFNDKLEILENNDVRKAIVMAIERKDKMPKNYVGSFYYHC